MAGGAGVWELLKLSDSVWRRREWTITRGVAAPI